MDIYSTLYELTGINNELALVRKRLGALNKRKRELTANAIEQMNEQGETQMVVNGQKYIIEEKQKRERKKSSALYNDTLTILNEKGIDKSEAEEIYKELSMVLKGSEKTIFNLKQVVKESKKK